MHELANADIRQEAKEAGVSLWELADEQGVPDAPLRGGERRSDGAIRGRLSLTAPNERNQRRRVSEPTLTRMLRHELSDVEKSDMLCSIGDVVDRHRAMGCSPI